jgi:predicted NAD/FAD-dependent oxidoreductase
VLHDSFNQSRQHSDLLFFKKDLAQVFTTPAQHFITNNGSKIQCAEKVKYITKDEAHFQVSTSINTYKSPYLVLATPAHITDKLLQHLSHSKKDTQTLLQPETASLQYYYEPICTLYLQYPESVILPQPMIGFFNTTAQWAIDRSINQQKGLIAVIISGSGQHTQIQHSQLVDQIHQELKQYLPELPPIISYKVIIERRATFSCRVNIEQQRPDNQTTIAGLFLAGDYTNTGYPATLEGAIKSGICAANKIANQLGHLPS